MNSQQVQPEPLSLEVKNIGGIDETSVQFQWGVTLLKGRNATNRTSLLRSIMAAMGSDRFYLKGDADHGLVRLSLDGTVVERTFHRVNGSIQADGDAYLDDPELADLFAYLLQDNEARRAVIQGDDLRELIARPIDTESINNEIEQVQKERRDVEERIETIEKRRSKLPQLEKQKNQLETAIEKKRDHLEELEIKIEEADADIEETREQQSETERQLSELKERRSELDDVRFQIETARETIDSLLQEQEEKRRELEQLSADPESDIEELQTELDNLRGEKRDIDAEISELQNVIEFNEKMLEGTRHEIITTPRNEEPDSGAATEKLLEDEKQVVCWTCGSEEEQSEIEDMLERLRSLRTKKIEQRGSLQEEIETTEDAVSKLETNQQRTNRLEGDLSDIEDKVEQKKIRVSKLEDRKDSLLSSIDELESAIEEQETSDYTELLELHKEVNRVEIEIEQREDELEAVREEISEVKSLAEERDENEQRLEELSERLTQLRNRIQNLEKEAVTAFNQHMEEILEMLDYDNIERIWIEQIDREVRDGRRKIKQSEFELHIVRESESGESYRSTINTLSESEREVTGLVFALAGYLVHDVHESVPVMLLDSLESIDSTRLNRLIDYFSDYSEILIVAVLPEDAEAVEVPHETISELG